MEAEAVSKPVSMAAGGGDVLAQKKNRIQVSNTKKSLLFYVKLVKRYMKQHDEVEISALGMAITSVVMIAGILKNNGLATEKKVLTSLVGIENKGRVIQKARIEIVLAKTENFDALMTAKDAKASERIAGDANEEQKEAASSN